MTQEHGSGLSVSLPANQDRLLLRDVDLADLLGCSPRHIWTMDSSGRIPRSIRFGKLVRWSRFEIVEWIMAGCPCRKQWQEMERTRNRLP